MRNNQRLVYKGIRQRIIRAIAKDQLWKLTALHLWRISFPTEAAQEWAGARK